jgi:hypothetical protein
MADNPYAAPKSHVADVAETPPDGEFVPDGRGVPAGHGWRWIADGWALTGLQRGTFIGVFLLLMVLAIVLSLVPLLGSLVVALLMPVFVGGLWIGVDALRRGGRLEVGHLFAGFQSHAGKLIALGALSLGALVVMALIVALIFGSTIGLMFVGRQPSPDEVTAMLGSVLLASLVMMALSIPWYMAVWFATPLIVLGRSDVGPALKTSFTACLKNIVPFLVWGLAMIGLSILASIPLMLGWLLLGPTMLASIYTSYRDIFYEV